MESLAGATVSAGRSRGGGGGYVVHALAVRPRLLESTEHCSRRTDRSPMPIVPLPLPKVAQRCFPCPISILSMSLPAFSTHFLYRCVCYFRHDRNGMQS